MMERRDRRLEKRAEFRQAAPRPSDRSGDQGRTRVGQEAAVEGLVPGPWEGDLSALRDSIDNIDAALIHLLADRFKCTQRVGVLKAQYRLPAADPGREARQIARLRGLAEQAKLDPAFAEKFLAFIIREVIRHHEDIARG